MIYNIPLSELILNLSSFLATVEDDTSLVSRSNFEKYPVFNLYAHEIENFITDCKLFLEMHPKYTSLTRIAIEERSDQLKKIGDTFSSKDKAHEKYKLIKNGLEDIQNSKITDRATFTLYKNVHTFPFDSQSQCIELFIDSDNKLFLDLQGLAYIIQCLDFPLNFKEPLKTPNMLVKVSSPSSFEKLQSILPSLTVEMNNSLYFLENTPINLSNLIFDNGIAKKNQVVLNDNIFLNIIENTDESQANIYNRFKDNPFQSSIDGLFFLSNLKDNHFFKLAVMDIEHDALQYDPNFIFIPFQYNTPDEFVLQIPNNPSLTHYISLFMDCNEHYDSLIFHTVLQMMLKEKTTFLDISFDDILNQDYFTQSFHDKNELVRIQKNAKFAYNIINKEVETPKISGNSFSELTMLSLALGYSPSQDFERISRTNFYMPLAGKSIFLSQIKHTVYNDEYLHKDNKNIQNLEFSKTIQNDMFNIIDNSFDNDLKFLVDYFVNTYQHPIFNNAFEYFLHIRYPNLSKLEIIQSFVKSNDNHLNQLGVVLFILDKSISFQDLNIDISSLSNAFYFSNFAHIELFYNKFHSKLDIYELFDNREKIANFQNLVFKVIRYKGILHADSNLFNNFPTQFFIDAAHSDEFLNSKYINLTISEENLIRILDHDDIDELTMFLSKFGGKYKEINSNLLDKKHMILLNQLVPHNTKSFVNNLIRMGEQKYINQEYFDFFIEISPLSVISIVDEFPLHIISIPKNMIKILSAIISNSLDAKRFYLKVSPEVYNHYSLLKENINTINESVCLLLEESLLEKSIHKVATNKQNVLKF